MTDGSDTTSDTHERPLSVLACQIHIPPMRRAHERDEHVERIVGLIDHHLNEQGADLVVLPELSTIDYSRTAFKCLDRLAESLDGPSCRRFSELARRYGTTIVFGLPRIAEDGFRISQVVIGPDGVIGYYDKIHTAQFGASMEKEFFHRGERTFDFMCGGLRAAPIICYDIRIPELSRALVIDRGVDLLLHCGAYARDESFPSWKSFVVTRAMENQIYMLSLNRAGSAFGASMFCPPWVDDTSPMIEFPAIEEALVRLVVDRKEIERVQDTLQLSCR